MKLSKKAIDEYKEIYKRKFGEEITDQEAYEQASNLLRLFKVIYRPLPSEKKNKNSKYSCN